MFFNKEYSTLGYLALLLSIRSILNKMLSLNPSAVKEVASNTPEIGFVINPVKPLNKPLKIPFDPWILYSLYGSYTNPLTPEYTPFPIL